MVRSSAHGASIKQATAYTLLARQPIIGARRYRSRRRRRKGSWGREGLAYPPAIQERKASVGGRRTQERRWRRNGRRRGTSRGRWGRGEVAEAEAEKRTGEMEWRRRGIESGRVGAFGWAIGPTGQWDTSRGKSIQCVVLFRIAVPCGACAWMLWVVYWCYLLGWIIPWGTYLDGHVKGERSSLLLRTSKNKISFFLKKRVILHAKLHREAAT